MADPNNGGAQFVVADGGVPRSFTGRARTAISGGQYVVCSGAAGAIGSTSSGFNPGSIVVDILQDSDFANGIALTNVGSNGLVTVVQNGIWCATAGGVCSGGHAVYVASGTVQHVIGQPIAAYSGGQTQVGRTIIPADSGTTNYGLFSFNFS
jgi:hypothetical protein